MKVSIVIPTFNQGQFIRDCLLSIQNQTFKDFEVIIQDSLSDDGTEKICRDFVAADARFQYFREKDTGQSDAINRGLVHCTGEAWIWICSDDYYSNPRALEVLSKKLERTAKKDQRVVGVFGDAQYVSEQGQVVGPYCNRTRDLQREDFKRTWPVAQPSCLLFLSAVKEAGGVDASMYFGMDLDLYLKVLKDQRRFVYVPEMIVNIRLQPNSKSVKYRKQTAENALAIVEKHFGDIGNPAESAYLVEFNEAKLLEFRERIRTQYWYIYPLFKAVWKLQNYANYYMNPEVEERSVGIYLFRGFWGTYRFLKGYLWKRSK